MVHIVSDPSLQRPGYVYDEMGVGIPIGLKPKVNWKHIDGPLLYTSDAGLHWLTWRERFMLMIRATDIETIDKERRRK
jgi:hypothetical protein